MTLYFPDELAAFRARIAALGYAALILLGSGQPRTAVLVETRSGAGAARHSARCIAIQ